MNCNGFTFRQITAEALEETACKQVKAVHPTSFLSVRVGASLYRKKKHLPPSSPDSKQLLLTTYHTHTHKGQNISGKIINCTNE